MELSIKLNFENKFTNKLNSQLNVQLNANKLGSCSLKRLEMNRIAALNYGVRAR